MACLPSRLGRGAKMTLLCTGRPFRQWLQAGGCGTDKARTSSAVLVQVNGRGSWFQFSIQARIPVSGACTLLCTSRRIILADEAADLPVGKTLLHQLGNLQFLTGELGGRCSRVPRPSPATPRGQLASGSFRKDSDVHVGQSIVRDCDLVACLAYTTSECELKLTGAK
jgi:hypothetical protein